MGQSSRSSVIMSHELSVAAAASGSHIHAMSFLVRYFIFVYLFLFSYSFVCGRGEGSPLFMLLLLFSVFGRTVSPGRAGSEWLPRLRFGSCLPPLRSNCCLQEGMSGFSAREFGLRDINPLLHRLRGCLRRMCMWLKCRGDSGAATPARV